MPYLGGTAPPVTTTVVQTVQPVASASPVNAKVVGATALYTVPTGKTFVATAAFVRCTAATAITSGPTLGIGIAAGEDDMFASTAITALTTTSKVFGFSALGMSIVAPAGAVIKVGIDAASTGTSQTLSVDLMGYVV